MSRTPPPTEEELLTRLRRNEVSFPPLILEWKEPSGKQADGVVAIAWQKQRFEFTVECKRLSSPKAIAEAAEESRARAQSSKFQPLVIAPFLDERALDALEARAVSGIDLCGNGVVTVPGKWFVRRTGAPNLFPAEGVIKNVYRNTSSVVARLFLAQPEFDSVQEALSELTRRGGRVTLPTVSKVCKELANDLVIERTRNGVTKLRLIQPEKLLERLAANYSPPSVTRRVTGKLRGIDATEFRKLLREWGESTKNQIALSGTSSVSSYAVMARERVEDYYCTDMSGMLKMLGDRFEATERFATVSFLETRNDEVFFDRRESLVASPVQTFLELTSGDKRDQDTADQVRRVVMNAVTPSAAK